MVGHICIEAIPSLKDNYAWGIWHPAEDWCVVIDPSETAPVLDFLKLHSLKLTHIFATHHHDDHVNAIEPLRSVTNALFAGSVKDFHRLPFLDIAVKEGKTSAKIPGGFQVLDTPGHTQGHIAWYLPSASAVFCGDTLFILGCGLLFEGSAEEMWQSLVKLRSLPEETLVYCGHEYTAAHIHFARSFFPEDEKLLDFEREVKEKQQKGKPTVPVPLSRLKHLNLFLQADSKRLAHALGLESNTPASSVFATLRSSWSNIQ